jgi:hypothetical protein
VQVDRALAAKYLSSRLWLPVVVTPVIGVGAALALWSWVWQGLTLVALVVSHSKSDAYAHVLM